MSIQIFLEGTIAVIIPLTEIEPVAGIMSYQGHYGGRGYQGGGRSRGRFSNNYVGHPRIPQPSPLSVPDEPDLGFNEDTSENVKYETQKRMELFQKIMDNKTFSINDRIQEFRQLDRKQQLVFFFPEGVTSESIPPLDPPSDWDDRVKTAIATLEEDVKEVFTNRKRPREHDANKSTQKSDGNTPADYEWEKNNPRPKETDPEYEKKLKYWEEDRKVARRFNCDDSDSTESMSDDGMYDEDESQSYAPALPLTAPFLVMAVAYNLNENSQCYCPCGKHMDRWRQYFGIDSFVEENHFACEYKGNALPKQIWKHVLTKKDNCKGHWVVYAFLKTVFQNYHSKQHQHIALEDVGTKQYNDANRIFLAGVKE
jgi:hypothetical protein